jgi:thiamine-monophosphate kinase
MLKTVPRKPQPAVQPAAQPAVRPAAAGELALIERIRSRAAGAAANSSHLRLGIGDDCAILRPPAGHDLLVTTDFSLETRHFRRDTHPPQSIGHRALARGLSDLAAMGAKPLAAFLSLALPKSLASDATFLEEFLDGLLTLAAQNQTPLAGGDTSESPSNDLLADIVLLGHAPAHRALRRSTARAAELNSLLSQPTTKPGAPFMRSHAGDPNARSLCTGVVKHERVATDLNLHSHPHLYPQPRLAVGQALLRRNLATACIDLSDGLSTDLNHLCTASNVAAELDVALLPAHRLTANLPDAQQIANILHGGEDYELLFTAAPTTRIPRSIANVPITRIGRILPWKPRSKHAARMTILTAADRFTLEPQGWEHLK